MESQTNARLQRKIDEVYIGKYFEMVLVE